MTTLATLLSPVSRRPRCAGETGPEFPAIASLVARWEADQIIPTDGHVATWPDASGHGRDLTAPTTGSRPTYNATDPDFNGQPSVTFDGTNDTLVNLSMPEMGTAVTVIDVLRVADPMPGFGILTVFYNSGLTVAGPGNICGFYGDHVYQAYVGIDGGNVASRTYLTTPFISRLEFSSAVCRHQVSGSEEATGTSGTLNGAATVCLFMASNADTNAYLNCTIAARFVFNDVLGPEELDALLVYIEAQYGVTL